MNHLNRNDQKVERALTCVTLSQDAKYRIKNKINGASSRAQRRSGKKHSSAAVIAVTLVSLLVITAAAVGGLSLFNAIYGDNADVVTPYGIAIGTAAQNKDVLLTLHESVADEYATAYIFSVKGLTDAGKALVASNVLDPNADEIVFSQTNRGKTVVHTVIINNYTTTSVERTPPEENADCQLYELLQKKNPDGDYLYFDIGLRRNDVVYNAENNASYVIIPIESLREESREYYALYVITAETHQLTLTFGDLELPLPEATIQIPGREIRINGYIQDYFLTEEGMSKIMSDYPISAMLTPLGLYVNDNRTRSLMYQYAALVFQDGGEKELSGISNDKTGIVSWKPRHFSNFYRGAVYLFNEIMDVQTVKSLLFYNEIEFPFDGNAPFVRSSGRTLNLENPKAQLWDLAEQIKNYVDEICPCAWMVTNPHLTDPYEFTGWFGVNYVSDDVVNFYRMRQDDSKDAIFTVSLTEMAGGTLEDEARAMVEKMNAQLYARGFENNLAFTVADGGACNGADVLVVECGESLPGLYKRCIFALYEGKLLTIAYDGYTGQPTDYAFDALLELITFN